MCAVFGLIDYKHVLTTKQRNLIMNTLAVACEKRGTDATGFAYNSRNHLVVYKRPLAAHNLKLKLPDDANVIIGHTRMTTQGSENCNYNNHPFIGHCDTTFALAHNGVLCNDTHLRSIKGLPETHIQTDSYIAVQLLEHYNELTLKTLASVAEDVSGSFVFTVLDLNNTVYFVKGSNPLAVYHYQKHGFYVYASTSEILDEVLSRLGILKYDHEIIELMEGDIISIDAEGSINSDIFQPAFDFYSQRYYDSYWDRATYSSSDVDCLFLSAASEGFSEEDILLLFDCGYMPDEIEELLYYPSQLHSILEELYLYTDYDSSEEL